MRFAFRSLLVAVSLITSVTACDEREGAKGSAVDGTWQIVDVVATGVDSITDHSPQPSIVIFSSPFYSWSRVIGGTPRLLYRAQTPTDSERLAAFNSFAANSGRFAITDSTLTLHPIVARNPNFMAGGSETYRYRISRDTLWLTTRASDFVIRLGEQLVPLSSSGEERLILVRLRT